MSVNYLDFQPETTTRVREAIEWSTTYTYNSNDTKNPRVLLIGDSICNGYQSAVRTKLADCANITFWASSKCVTDPDYLRELDFIIGAYKYDLISFNNGLHSLVTPPDEWAAAYRAAVKFIRAKLPDAKLVLTLCTSLNDKSRDEKACRLNELTKRIASELELPLIDLYTPMSRLDKDENMRDVYHYKAPAVDIQAGIIAEYVKSTLTLSAGVQQLSTETGPSGALN